MSSKEQIYEIHITVNITKEEYLKQYKDWKYKSICIDLLNNETHTMFNLVTKDRMAGLLLQSYIEHELKLPIVRRKIETNLNSEDVCYGEVHLEINKKYLNVYKSFFKYYPSQNILKPDVIMLTGRFYNQRQLDTIKDDFNTLKRLGYIAFDSKLIIEYCIFDDNINLDDSWIEA